MSPKKHASDSKPKESSSHADSPYAGSLEERLDALKPLADVLQKMATETLKNPTPFLEHYLKWQQEQMALWAHFSNMLQQKATADSSSKESAQPAPFIAPDKEDRRFQHPLWQDGSAFDFMKQSYLLTRRMLMDMAAQQTNLDAESQKKLLFYTRLFTEAMAPNNMPFLNPEVLEKTYHTQGQNLVSGLHNLLQDWQRGNGQFTIRMSDDTAFKMGENIATTEGAVVFENRLMQLIQYSPKTPHVYATPLLIFPPWINKFYILDLQAHNSFVRYAVEEAGLTVFMVSWKNPDASYRDTTWEDYLAEGVFPALEAVLSISQTAQANVIGYCIGGTLLASALAMMARKGDTRVKSATFFTSLVDFSEPGELGVFIDEDHVSRLEKAMFERGYLEGSEMAATFASLRATDLIWHFAIRQYLLGEDPTAFDLLYWNGDNTRMPAAMHSFYLRNMYLENNLIKKDALTLLNTPIDLSQINLPLYMVSAVNDHITPWQGCYKGVQILQKGAAHPARFVLSKAGHVAGVVNPPLKSKRAYWVADATETDAATWLEQAENVQGSWWPDWRMWVNAQSGAQISAPKVLGNKTYPPLEAAPGRYVSE